jgi:hypothetical protein
MLPMDVIELVIAHLARDPDSFPTLPSGSTNLQVAVRRRCDALLQ